VTGSCQPADTLLVGVTASVSGLLGFGFYRQMIYLEYRRETKFCLAIWKDTDDRYDICFKFPVTHQTHNNLSLYISSHTPNPH